MQKGNRNSLLRLVLVIAGVLFCMSGVGAVLPVQQLKNLAGIFVGGEQVNAMWPDEALFDYLLRASCIAYFWIGLTFFAACRNPLRYRILIDMAIGGLILFGVVCVVVGMKDKLPVAWFLGDSLLSFIGAILLIILRPRYT